MSGSDNVIIHPAMIRRIRWLDFPLITVPNPDNPDVSVTAKLSDETLHRLYRANRKTSLWQAWGHIAGSLPPIPNISVIRNNFPKGSLSGMDRAVACFRGLNRPHRNEEEGQSVITYVLNPTYTLAFDSSLVCVARAARAPAGTVMTVYMRPQDTLHEPMKGISGIITGWEFIPSDPDAGALPENYRERYGAELWRR